VRYAILSDVHGNLEALRAVLADAAPARRLLCLGDSVGYGPIPWRASSCWTAVRAPSSP